MPVQKENQRTKKNISGAIKSQFTLNQPSNTRSTIMKIRFFSIRLRTQERHKNRDKSDGLKSESRPTQITEIEDDHTSQAPNEEEDEDEFDCTAQGHVRFNLQCNEVYEDNLRRIHSPLEWNACWYHSDTLERFRLEALAAAHGLTPAWVKPIDESPNYRPRRSCLKTT